MIEIAKQIEMEIRILEEKHGILESSLHNPAIASTGITSEEDAPRVAMSFTLPIVMEEMVPSVSESKVFIETRDYSSPRPSSDVIGHDLMTIESAKEAIGSGKVSSASASLPPPTTKSLFNNPEAVFMLPIVQSVQSTEPSSSPRGEGEKEVERVFSHSSLSQPSIEQSILTSTAKSAEFESLRANVKPIQALINIQREAFRTGRIGSIGSMRESSSDAFPSQSRQVMVVMNNVTFSEEMGKLFHWIKKMNYSPNDHLYILCFSQTLNSALFTSDGGGGGGNSPTTSSHSSIITEEESMKSKSMFSQSSGIEGIDDIHKETEKGARGDGINSSNSNYGNMRDFDGDQVMINSFMSEYSRYFSNWTFRIVKVGMGSELITFVLDSEWKRHKNDPITVVMGGSQDNISEWIVNNCPGDVLIVK